MKVRLCPNCKSELYLLPLDDPRELIVDECPECGYTSEPRRLYVDALSAEIVYDDILDADVIEVEV